MLAFSFLYSVDERIGSASPLLSINSYLPKGGEAAAVGWAPIIPDSPWPVSQIIFSSERPVATC
jgi:hypothetical protein